MGRKKDYFVHEVVYVDERCEIGALRLEIERHEKANRILKQRWCHQCG